MASIPVTFTYKGQEYSGTLDQVFGAGNANVFYLMVNKFYWGRLRLSAYNNQWMFDPTPKTKGLEELVHDFEALLISHFQ